MADILDLDIHHSEDMTIDDDGEEIGIEKLKERVRKRKGRGFTSDNPTREVLDNFESISATDNEPSDVQAQRSVEGWILIITGIHEEAHEDDVQGRFSEYGEIKNLHLNLDRRTGFLKGYALIEYEHFKDAVAAKGALEGAELLGNVISVDWAFMKKPLPTSRRSRRH